MPEPTSVHELFARATREFNAGQNELALAAILLIQRSYLMQKGEVGDDPQMRVSLVQLAARAGRIYEAAEPCIVWWTPPADAAKAAGWKPVLPKAADGFGGAEKLLRITLRDMESFEGAIYAGARERFTTAKAHFEEAKKAISGMIAASGELVLPAELAAESVQTPPPAAPSPSTNTGGAYKAVRWLRLGPIEVAIRRRERAK